MEIEQIDMDIKKLLALCGLTLVLFFTGCRAYHGYHYDEKVMKETMKFKELRNVDAPVVLCFQSNSKLFIEVYQRKELSYSETKELERQIVYKYSRCASWQSKYIFWCIPVVGQIGYFVQNGVTPFTNNWKLDKNGPGILYLIAYTPPVYLLNGLFMSHPKDAINSGCIRSVRYERGTKFDKKIEKEFRRTCIDKGDAADVIVMYRGEAFARGKVSPDKIAVIDLKPLGGKVTPEKDVTVALKIGGQTVNYVVSTSLLLGSDTVFKWRSVQNAGYSSEKRLAILKDLYAGKLISDKVYKDMRAGIKKEASNNSAMPSLDKIKLELIISNKIRHLEFLNRKALLTSEINEKDSLMCINKALCILAYLRFLNVPESKVLCRKYSDSLGKLKVKIIKKMKEPQNEMTVCHLCRGTGVISGVRCPDCRGSGLKKNIKQQFHYMTKCSTCNGKGYFYDIRDRRGNAAVCPDCCGIGTSL